MQKQKRVTVNIPVRVFIILLKTRVYIIVMIIKICRLLIDYVK